MLVVPCGIDLLRYQHRQVLSHGMTEVRSENSHVITHAKSGANNRLVLELIGDAEARCEGMKVISDVAVQTPGP